MNVTVKKIIWQLRSSTTDELLCKLHNQPDIVLVITNIGAIVDAVVAADDPFSYSIPDPYIARLIKRELKLSMHTVSAAIRELHCIDLLRVYNNINAYSRQEISEYFNISRYFSKQYVLRTIKRDTRNRLYIRLVLVLIIVAAFAGILFMIFKN